MTFRLRDNLDCCLCDGRPIFLDIEADRYFALQPAAEQAFLRLASGEALPADRPALDGLVARRLLVEDGAAAPWGLGPPVPAAARDYLDERHCRPRAVDLLRALAAELGAARRLKRRTFASVLAQAERACRRAPRPGHAARLDRIVAASACASYFIRATDRCLVRALALHSVCRRFGIPAQLVFGVRINPFGAHCWVQHGDSVLIGDFEQARLFTPIKVIG